MTSDLHLRFRIDSAWRPERVVASKRTLVQILFFMVIPFYTSMCHRSTMNGQGTAQKGGGYLLTNENMKKTVERLGKPFLNDDDFKQLLDLWREKGFGNWFIKKKLSGADKRREFIKRLKNESEKWKDLIFPATRRVNSDERGIIKRLLEKTDDNPLLVLNQIGYPPHWILSKVDYVYDNEFNQEQFLQICRDKSLPRKHANNLNMAAMRLRYYQPIIGEESEFFKTLHNLKRYAEKIQNFRPTDVLPPWELVGAKGGAPNKKLFTETVGELMSISLTEPVEESPNSTGSLVSNVAWQLREATLEKIKEGALTAVMMAAFEKWFQGQTNPMRNCKNAAKRWSEIFPVEDRY